jgi:hypothetical protein
VSYTKVQDLPDGAWMFCHEGLYYCATGWHVPGGTLKFETPEAARLSWELRGKPEDARGRLREGIISAFQAEYCSLLDEFKELFK